MLALSIAEAQALYWQLKPDMPQNLRELQEIHWQVLAKAEEIFKQYPRSPQVNFSTYILSIPDAAVRLWLRNEYDFSQATYATDLTDLDIQKLLVEGRALLSPAKVLELSAPRNEAA
jgi:hypothetical protein